MLKEDEEIVMLVHVSEIWVPAYVQGTAVPMLSDTSTSRTILTVEAYKGIPGTRRPELDPPNLVLKQASGSRVNVWGRTVVKLRVGSQVREITVIVAEVTGCMLGMDFLRDTGASFDFWKLQLQWGRCVVQCAPSREIVFTLPARVVATEDIDVPVGHTRVVSAAVSGRNEVACLGLLEPFVRGRLPERGLFVVRSAVCAAGRYVPVSVSNVGDRLKRVKRGTALGYKVVPIVEGDLCSTRMVVTEPEALEERPLPEHLRELLGWRRVNVGR